MKQTRILMGMPITITVVDKNATEKDIEDVFNYFIGVDKKFSTYKKDSEISKINAGLLKKKDFSEQMQLVLLLAQQTKKETNGYFDIQKDNGTLDPSGIVKGWAIHNAADLLRKKRFGNFSVEAGGDMELSGNNGKDAGWRIGIKNPFDQKQIIKVLELSNKGIATSGNYIRGAHIYNPKNAKDKLAEVVSMTVIGPNVYEADRFATAAFAMQKKGIDFIASLKGFAGYMIDKEGIAIYTDSFEQYVRTT